MQFSTDTIEKRYYTISEVADELRVNTSLIRFWEKEFPQLSFSKNHRGNRQFTRKDIDNLRQILILTKEKGYTLEGAKKTLRTKIKEESTPDVREKLLLIREKLNVIASRL